MKAVILAGGMGSRISEESYLRPKPMIEIGGKPILWHIMKLYSHHGINDFIVCGGYKSYIIKEYFKNYFLHNSDVTFDLAANSVQVHQTNAEPWKVTVVDTGTDTMTGGRLKRVEKYLEGEDFCFTYGDGISDVNIKELIQFHQTHKRLATVTGIQAPGRFGIISYKGSQVTGFSEKPIDETGFINGGFFVLNPKALKYISNDGAIWEKEAMTQLAQEGQMSVYHHKGFWQSMDTLRDKNILEDLWKENPPWKVW